jgi:hypothetical protein
MPLLQRHSRRPRRMNSDQVIGTQLIVGMEHRLVTWIRMAIILTTKYPEMRVLGTVGKPLKEYWYSTAILNALHCPHSCLGDNHQSL